jgi:hypothetical protein
MFDNLGWHWFSIKDGDPRGRDILRRHYSARHYKDNRNPRIFVGPGEKAVLLTADGKALFIWRKFINDDNQAGINCAAFRNEGPLLSSTLILEAEEIAWKIWPGERLYTYVYPPKIKSKNPGYCFKMAGWKLVRNPDGKAYKCKSGKIVLEKLPREE